MIGLDIDFKLIYLAILVVVFRNRQTINVEDLSSLKG